MIKIELKFFATIARYLPKSSQAFSVEEGTTIKSLVSRLNIPESEVKLTFVNGKQRPLNHILQDGERLGIFPPVGGG